MADLNYIESGYFTPDSGYYVYTADADSAISTSASITCAISKTSDAASTITASFTTTAYGARERDIDLFAFTNASIAVQVDRLRDTNTDATGYFSVAIDVSKTKSFEADEYAAFDFSVVFGRSRDTTMDTQAAFSFDANVDRFRGIESTIQSESTLSTDADKITDYQVILNEQVSLSCDFEVKAGIVITFFSNFTTSASVDKVKEISASYSSEFALSAVISNVKGVDIVAEDFASVSADINKIAEGATSLTSSFTASSDIGKLKDGTINVNSQFSFNGIITVFTRTTSVTTYSGGSYNTAVIDSSVKKFGTGSLSFTIDPGTTPSGNAVWNGTNFRYVQAGYTWTSTDGLSWTRQSNNLGVNLYNIVWTNNRYVSFDSNYGNTIYSSTDGLTWSSVSFSAGTDLTDFKRDVVFYTGGYYHIYGYYTSSTFRIGALRSTSLSGPWTRIELSNTGVAPTGYGGGVSISSINWHQTGYIVLAYTADSVTSVTGAASLASTVLRLGAGDASLTNRSAQVYPYGTYGNSYTALKADFAESKSQIAVYAYSAAAGNSFLRYSLNNGTTWASNTSIINIQSIKHINDKWMISTTAGLYTGTNINSLTLVNSNITTPVSYGSSKWLAKSSTPGYALYSSDSTSWTYDAIDPQPLPASLVYSRGNNSDISSFKTLDFWMYHNATNGRKFFFSQDANNYINFSLGTNYAELKSVASGTAYTLRVDETNVVANNTWNHFRISVDGSLAALYVNGVRKAYITNFTNSTIAPFTIGGDNLTIPPQETFKLDEMLISDQLLTLTSTTSFSVPTDRWYNDSSEKDLLIHFDTNFADDTEFDVNPTAFITSTSQVSASIGGTFGISTNLQSQFTQISNVSVDRSSEIVAFNNASIDVIIGVIKPLESNISASASTSIIASQTISFIADVSTTANVETTVNKFRDVESALTSTFTQTANVKRIRGVFNNFLFVNTAMVPRVGILKEYNLTTFNSVTLTADVGKIVNISNQQSSNFDISVVITKTSYGVIDLNVETTLSSEAVVQRDAVAALEVSSAILSASVKTTDVIELFTNQSTLNLIPEITREVDSNNQITANINIDAIKNVSVQSNISALAFEITAAVKTTDIIELLASSGTLDISFDRTRTTSSDINAEFTLTANGVQSNELESYISCATSLTADVVKNVEAQISTSIVSTLDANTQDSLNSRGSADLTSNITTSIAAVKSVSASIQTESIASSLTIAVKETATDINCDVSSTLTVGFTKIVQLQSNQSVSTALSLEIDKFTSLSSQLTSNFTLESSAYRIIDFSIATDAIASELAAVSKIAKFFINADCSVNLAATAKVIRSAISVQSAVMSTAISGKKITDSTLSISSQATQIANATKSIVVSATLLNVMSFIVSIKEIQIDDIYYKIPAEDWSFVIVGETRTLTLVGETRNHKITQETAMRTIADETRLYTVN